MLALASFVSAANLRMCDPLLPQIAGDLRTTVGAAAMVVTAFAVAYGVLQVILGPLGDARGKILLVMLGSLWAGVCTIIAAAMPGLGSLTVARFLAGAGAAAVIPLAMAWIGDVIPYEYRQPVLARFLTGQILGIVFGQAAGGILGELMGWRATMAVLGALHLGMGLLLIAEQRRLKVGQPASVKVRWRETGTSAYLVLQQPWVRVILGTVFLEGMFMFGAFAYIGADLHQRFGAGFGLAGAMIGTFGAGALTYALSARSLVARLGQSGLAAAGAGALAAGYTTLAILPRIWLAPPAVALVGLGYYMLHNTLQTNATQMVPEARGLSLSLFAFMLFTSQSVGVALAAPIMDRYGAPPIFLIAAASLLVIGLWFCRQLINRSA